jgi:nucleotide-binding universal stress UspA family protein
VRILLAADGRPPALGAEELVRRLLDPSHAEVAIVHAIEYGVDLAGEEHATAVLGAAEARFREAGVGCRTIRIDEDPALAIEKELAREDYAAVALGAGNHTWLGRLVFGSVSTHLLHVAPCPVLVVHRGPVPGHDRIRVLVGADGSPAAMEAIATLLSLTSPDRVDISVRSVIRPPDVPFAAYPGGVVPVRYLEEVDAEAERVAERALERSIERIRVAGYEAHGSLGRGWPANDLLDRADRDEVDLVVMGARGVGRIERITMGSISAHVARHAPATFLAHASTSMAQEEPIGERPSARRWR